MIWRSAAERFVEMRTAAPVTSCNFEIESETTGTRRKQNDPISEWLTGGFRDRGRQKQIFFGLSKPDWIVTESRRSSLPR